MASTGPSRTSIPPQGRLLAVDWGEKRIGLAVADEVHPLAPLAFRLAAVAARMLSKSLLPFSTGTKFRAVPSAAVR